MTAVSLNGPHNDDHAISSNPIEEDKPIGLAPALTIERLFREHAADVYRMLGRLLGREAGSADLEDLTQQVFIAAHRALPRFRGGSSPRTWLLGIASNLAMVFLRGKGRRLRLFHALEREPIRDTVRSAEDVIEARERLRIVSRCLEMLNPKKRMVYVLHELEGLGTREIAEVLNTKETTVRTRLFHARKELARHLLESQERVR